jgi:hypothetical protein
MTSTQAREIERILTRAYAQPKGQTIPQEFLAMLAELDRSKR